MKIAIPTDDGIFLSAFVKNPKAYLVLTIEGGEIINEELRWNILNEIVTAEKKNPNKLQDCSLMIVNAASNEPGDYLKSDRIEVISSKEVIITKIIMEYLKTTLLRESNTCCMP